MKTTKGYKELQKQWNARLDDLGLGLSSTELNCQGMLKPEVIPAGRKGTNKFVHKVAVAQAVQEALSNKETRSLLSDEEAFYLQKNILESRSIREIESILKQQSTFERVGYRAIARRIQKAILKIASTAL